MLGLAAAGGAALVVPPALASGTPESQHRKTLLSFYCDDTSPYVAGAKAFQVFLDYRAARRTASGTHTGKDSTQPPVWAGRPLPPSSSGLPGTWATAWFGCGPAISRTAFTAPVDGTSWIDSETSPARILVEARPSGGRNCQTSLTPTHEDYLDPNHLNLGIRFGGNPHDEVVKAAHGFDVFSVNIYRYAPDRAVLDRIYGLVPRPILIGEFHIGAPERGLAPGLVQAMSQVQRAVAYQYYVEQCAAHPTLVGTHWFQYLDQPATGRNDGENYNIGFVDVTDQPHAELVAAAKLTHGRLLEVHSGKAPPFSQKPRASEAETP